MVERRTPTLIQLINSVTPMLVLALLSWIALQIVDVKIDIPAIKRDVAAIRADLSTHDVRGKEDALRISILHHRTGIEPCSGCHKHEK